MTRTRFNYWISRQCIGITVLLLFLLLSFKASAQQYPVSVNTFIEPPYSPYFSDYISLALNKWKSHIILNDHNEPSWDVKLRITIESNNLQIKTRTEFVPPAPITVFPGVPVQIGAAELAPYLSNYNALILNGITAAKLSTNARLPEGFYNFCVEVLDYKTGEVLSLKSCFNAWIQLNDEPIPVLPVCGSVVSPGPVQNIFFNWHQIATVSPTSLGTEYNLTLYEITDPTVNPLNSIQNNKVLKIYQSDFQIHNSLAYDMTMPVLDVGKRYAYTIQARDIEGKDLFKNKGVSQVCWFHYGYPADGLILLQQPINEGSFGKDDPLYFQWSAPDKKLPGQLFSYYLKVVKVNENQNAEEAIQFNLPFYEETTIATNRTTGFDLQVAKTLDPLNNYAWQVTAFTDEQEIAKSIVHTFRGPGLIDKFRAGDHEVLVKTTYNSDLSRLSGLGLVKLSADSSKTQEVLFTNLNIRYIAGQYVLTGGSIQSALTDTSLIELIPENQPNGNAWFHPKEFRLDKNALAVKGYVTWALPHPVTSFEQAQVITQTDWVNYDKFAPNGKLNLSEGNSYTLLDPYSFELKLQRTSYFLLDYKKFAMRLTGEVLAPEKVRGTGSGQVKFPFHAVNQLFYFTLSGLNLENNLKPVAGSQFVIKPEVCIIDLSEEQSPLKLQQTKAWKGVYIEKGNLIIPESPDPFGQLEFNHSITDTITLTTDNEFVNWIEKDGLSFQYKKTFTSNDSLIFNSFPSEAIDLTLTITRNSVKNSSLKGSLIIPFVSTSEKFTFTAPVSNLGFQPGYLDDIEGKAFTFNKGSGEQEVFITIQRAVFADRERLDMTLDLEWPFLSVSLNSVTGFKAWGNYNIGFIRPNGTMTLNSQVHGSLSEFPVMIDGIGAGSSDGAYSFGITGKAVLADDVSGNEGPPSVNLYSTVPNSFLPERESGSITQVPVNNIEESGTASSGEDSTRTIEQDYQIIQNEFVSAIQQSSVSNVSLNPELLSDGVVNESSPRSYEGSELVEPDTASEGDKSWMTVKFTVNQEKLVTDLTRAVSGLIAEPVTGKITEGANFVNEKINSQVFKLVDSVLVKIEFKVKTLVDSLAEKTIRATRKDTVDYSEEIHKIANTLSKEINKEIRASVYKSIQDNITGPVTGFISEDLAGRINALIEESVSNTIRGFMSDEYDNADVISHIETELPDIITDAGEKIYANVNFRTIKTAISETGTDIVANISLADIAERFTIALFKESGSIIRKKFGDKAAGQVKNWASNIVGGENSGALNAGIGVKLNFDNLGQNLKEGRVDKIIKLDPVTIAVNTKFVAFSGLINYSADDPVYGDIWRGDVGFKVKVPKEFSLGGTYVNGRKDGYSYWFCQISGVDESKQKPGGPLPKTAKPLDEPLPLGPVQLVAASGRLFHHMHDEPGRAILPDESINYGAFVNFIFFDKSDKGGALRLDVGAGIQISEDGNYLVDFLGNMQLGSPNPKIMVPDPKAMASGEVAIKYNSAESHFLGTAFVRVQRPGQLCAEGSLLADIKPGAWRVALGSREKRLIFVPGCSGWSPTGWLDVNQNTAELGLGLQFSLFAKAGFKTKSVSAEIGVDAGAAAGVLAVVQYKPTLALNEAGVWIELWGRVFVNYDVLAVGAGSITLVDIYCSGNMNVVFNPKPAKAVGYLQGQVEVLGIFGCEFDAGFEKTL